MTRSDILVQLVKAGMNYDVSSFKRLVEIMIAEERAQSHDVLAMQLEENLRIANAGNRKARGVLDERISSLFSEDTGTTQFSDLHLDDAAQIAFAQLVEEQFRRDLLRAHALEPRNRIILTGAPGNGKTSVATALANSLMLPLFVVRYDGLIGSFLGETSARLKCLFDFVSTRPCVLFFDEFDAIGKERGDAQETGEMRRIVSSLLLQIDKLPSHVVVVAASNHPEILDKAIWRRFQIHLELLPPDEVGIAMILDRLENRLGRSFNSKVRMLISKRFLGKNFGDLEEFCTDIQRRDVLNFHSDNLNVLAKRSLEERQGRPHLM